MGSNPGIWSEFELQIGELLAQSPKGLGCGLVNCVGTDTAWAIVIGRNHARDVAVLALYAAFAIKLRARYAPNSRGCPGLQALEVSRGLGNAALAVNAPYLQFFIRHIAK
jgi:hypothetical protein